MTQFRLSRQIMWQLRPRICQFSKPGAQARTRSWPRWLRPMSLPANLTPALSPNSKEPRILLSIWATSHHSQICKSTFLNFELNFSIVSFDIWKEFQKVEKWSNLRWRVDISDNFEFFDFCLLGRSALLLIGSCQIIRNLIMNSDGFQIDLWSILIIWLFLN